jgi:hypothetical protein
MEIYPSTMRPGGKILDLTQKDITAEMRVIHEWNSAEPKRLIKIRDGKKWVEAAIVLKVMI